MSEDGVQRSAILLMSIGEEEAVEVFKHLGPREVQKLGLAMSKLSHVTREQVADVLRRFRDQAERHTNIGTASDQYLRNVLTRALGNDRAAGLIDRILRDNDNSGIESLKWMDSAAVAELIGGEHPQIIATIRRTLRRQSSHAQAATMAAATQKCTSPTVAPSARTAASSSP
jgi:flagellar motor switch protein FliG